MGYLKVKWPTIVSYVSFAGNGNLVVGKLGRVPLRTCRSGVLISGF